MNLSFNIFLPHRHFALSNDHERLVRLHNDTGTSVLSVFTDDVPDPSIIDDYKLFVPATPAIVPFSFLVGETLIPFEYACVDRENLQAFQRMEVAPEFFKDWAAILHKNSVGFPLGLTLRSDGEPMIQLSDATRRVDVTMPLSNADQSSYFTAEWSIESRSDGLNHVPVGHSICGGSTK
jgi:hypothetical protein